MGEYLEPTPFGTHAHRITMLRYDVWLRYLQIYNTKVERFWGPDKGKSAHDTSIGPFVRVWVGNIQPSNSSGDDFLGVMRKGKSLSEWCQVFEGFQWLSSGETCCLVEKGFQKDAYLVAGFHQDLFDQGPVVWVEGSTRHGEGEILSLSLCLVYIYGDGVCENSKNDVMKGSKEGVGERKKKKKMVLIGDTAPPCSLVLLA